MFVTRLKIDDPTIIAYFNSVPRWVQPKPSGFSFVWNKATPFSMGRVGRTDFLEFPLWCPIVVFVAVASSGPA
jgi:hypothetical protein